MKTTIPPDRIHCETEAAVTVMVWCEAGMWCSLGTKRYSVWLAGSMVWKLSWKAVEETGQIFTKPSFFPQPFEEITFRGPHQHGSDCLTKVNEWAVSENGVHMSAPEKPLMQLYHFSITSATNYHKLSHLTQHKFILISRGHSSQISFTS